MTNQVNLDSVGNTPFYYSKRFLILVCLILIVLGVFWFGSRYPALLHKADIVGDANLQSFVYTSNLIAYDATASYLNKVFAASINWLDSMKIGMSFGAILGSLILTLLQVCKLPELSNNTFANTLRGAIIGAPAGVCVNCAVPISHCMIKSGTNKLETILGFLLSSPSLNPVVLSMTFFILPWQYGVVKYILLLLIIFAFVPLYIKYWRTNSDLKLPGAFDKQGESHCSIDVSNSDKPSESFIDSLKIVLKFFWKNFLTAGLLTLAWMVVASIIVAFILEALPMNMLFAETGILALLSASILFVFMPAPIAMEVMSAYYLYANNIASEYVFIALFALGSFSIMPFIALWRYASKRLAISLYSIFVLFAIIGCYLI